MTKTAEEIQHSLRVATQHPGEAFALISGTPGAGKSAAVLEYVQRNTKRCHLLKIAAGEGGTWNVAGVLCRMLGIDPPNGRQLPEERRRIAEAIGAENMLIIDEAQFLVQRNPRGRDCWEAFEWLRAMAEEGMLCLAFVGDLSLRDLQKIAPPLWRRLRRRVIITSTDPDDVRQVGAAWGIQDEKSFKVLMEIAKWCGGGLGDVVMVCREARTMAGGRAISLEDVLAAGADLKLFPIHRGRK